MMPAAGKSKTKKTVEANDRWQFVTRSRDPLLLLLLCHHLRLPNGIFFNLGGFSLSSSNLILVLAHARPANSKQHTRSTFKTHRHHLIVVVNNSEMARTEYSILISVGLTIALLVFGLVHVVNNNIKNLDSLDKSESNAAAASVGLMTDHDQQHRDADGEPANAHHQTQLQDAEAVVIINAHAAAVAAALADDTELEEAYERHANARVRRG